MAKNVLILSTSPRRKGNSAALAEAFAEGAREAGSHAEIVPSAAKNSNSAAAASPVRRPGAA